MARHIYTEVEDKLIMELYPKNPTELIAEKLNVTIYSVYARANLLGVKKDATYLLNQNKILGKRLAASDLGHRFEKGIIPVNKGKKQTEYMSPEGIERTKNTRFKKGQTATHLQHFKDRMITKRFDSKIQRPYWWIRISKRVWKMYHVEVWERDNGPVSKGNIIVFKDGNSLNCIIENLECITLAENMRRNTIQRYPEELKSTFRLIGKLKKKIENAQQD